MLFMEDVYNIKYNNRVDRLMVENSKKLGITDSATRIYEEAREIIG